MSIRHEIMIDTAQFLSMLENFQGHTIAFIRTVTSPLKIYIDKKTGKPKKQGVLVKSRVDDTPFEVAFGFPREDLICHATLSIMIGYNYATAMENANARDGLAPYVPGESWHEPYILPNGERSTTFVQHPDSKELYFNAIKNRWKTGVTPTPENAQRKTRAVYMYLNRKTGKAIPNADKIHEYLPIPDPSKRVPYFTLKLTSVKWLAFQKKIYVLA